jgi:uncharacterized LabA/DUF88 family protein
LDLTIARKFDVVVIVGGDSNYHHLVSKLNGIGVRVLVMGWNIQYEVDSPSGLRRKYIKTSNALMEECSYPVWLDRIIDQGMESNDKLVMNMFNY